MSKPLALRHARRRAQSRPIARDTARDIARINELTRVGRANWFGLLAYLTFVMITILGVKDADFFVTTRQTQLPIVGVAIPTFDFFIFAPVLAAALHVYLHLYIRKCTEALAQVAPQYKGAPIEDAISPWLLNDLVLRERLDRGGPDPIRRRPMDWLATVTGMLLIWVAGPYTLLYAWVQSLGARDEGISATIALCFAFSIYASLASWVKLRGDLGRRWLAGPRTRAAAFALACGVGIIHGGLSVGLTEGGVDRLRDPALRPDWTNGPMAAAILSLPLPYPDWMRTPPYYAGADLAGHRFAALPPAEIDPDIARHRFRVDWCRRNDLDPAICDRSPSQNHSPSAQTWERRVLWCQSTGHTAANGCLAYFSSIEQEFNDEWDSYRRAVLAALPKPDFSGQDLAYANLSHAALPGVTLTGAELRQADLSYTQMERVSLDEARMPKLRAEATNLRAASLQWSTLDHGFLVTADLAQANLHSSSAIQTTFLASVLFQANMFNLTAPGVNFTQSDLREANLSSSDLTGATFTDAKLNLTDLSDSRARGSVWSRTALSLSLVQGADLRGAKSLSQDQLKTTVGNIWTLLPDTPDPITGAPLYVCSCWHPETPGVAAALRTAAAGRTSSLAAHLCKPGETPQKTGLPWPADRPPPWGDPNQEVFRSGVHPEELEHRIENAYARGACPATP